MFSFKKLSDSKKRSLVMGILNVTPDSFSDGGKTFELKDVVEKVNMLCNEGADIIDVGACSTAPGNAIVTQDEELRRLEQFLPEIIRCSTVPVSLDTFRPAVARYALEQGVEIINDESGVYNKCMAECVSEYKCGWIFMHTGESDSSEKVDYPRGVMADVIDFFSRMRKEAVLSGLSEEQLCYDCGIGFGKTRQDDLELLSSCDKLAEFSPLLIGVSRKRIIGEITGVEEPCRRVGGSVAAATLAAYKGAGVLRVHDVEETVQALAVCEAIKKGVL